MATNINDIEDLMRILDENPQWVEALRARLLTRELLELPQKFAELSQTVVELSQTVVELSQTVVELSQTVVELSQKFVELSQKFVELSQTVAELSQKFVELSQTVAELSQKFVELSQKFAELVATVHELADELRATNRRLDRLQDDVGWLKGRIIYDIVRNDAALIADEMGFVLEKALVRADLMELTRGQDVSDLPRGNVLSFHRADLVMQVADEARGQCYIAVEASFTVNGRDSRRALRNAELMTRFTGQPAMAGVAGVRFDWELKPLIESEQLHWYEIPSEDLESE